MITNEEEAECPLCTNGTLGISPDQENGEAELVCRGECGSYVPVQMCDWMRYRGKLCGGKLHIVEGSGAWCGECETMFADGKGLQAALNMLGVFGSFLDDDHTEADYEKYSDVLGFVQGHLIGAVKPAEPTCWVLLYHHRHGTDVDVHPSRTVAEAVGASIVADNRHEFPDIPKEWSNEKCYERWEDMTEGIERFELVERPSPLPAVAANAQALVPVPMDEAWIEQLTAEIERWRADGSVPMMPMDVEVLRIPPNTHGLESLMAFSTAHITPETCGRLEAGAKYARMVPGPSRTRIDEIKTQHGHVPRDQWLEASFLRQRGMMRPEGFLLHVPENPDDWPEMPDDLEALFLKARTNNCCWLLLDADGPKHDDLPTWEW